MLLHFGNSLKLSLLSLLPKTAHLLAPLMLTFKLDCESSNELDILELNKEAVGRDKIWYITP